MGKARSSSDSKPQLQIRNATLHDLPAILALTEKVYPGMPPYQEGHIRGQINMFPEGVFVAEYLDQVVGFCSSFIGRENEVLETHTWVGITGGGYNSRHHIDGDFLYGMEVCVDPDHRRLRIGRRFYNARKKLAEYLQLKGIVIAGRIPGFSKKKKSYPTAEKYLDAVKKKEVRDQVISFQMRNGFEPLQVLPSYLPIDKASEGNAVLMVWRNPKFNPELVIETSSPDISLEIPQNSIRVTSVQYMQRRVQSFEEFMHIVEYFVDVASDYSSDFVIFPEWFTLQLLSMEKETLRPKESLVHLASYTERFRKEMNKLALQYNINIIGGSTAVIDPKTKQLKNVAFVFLRDGTIYEQAKLHATPNEKHWWDLKGGSGLQAIHTDVGTIGVLICYDAEFPELVRHLVDQGMKILFVPFCTDERQSYMRVRYCAQARAIENQIYVVMSGNCGNLPRVENMDIQYAQSCILTPCDFPFARDGVAADTTPNVEAVAVADLRLDSLLDARRTGTVQNLKDRRHDLYHLQWREQRS